MFKRILVAVDASEQSARAVEVVADLADRYGAEVTVEHVAAERMTLVGAAPEPMVPVYFEADERESRALVNGVVGRLRAAGVRASGEVLTGPGRVAGQLETAADKYLVDLVVVGSRGRSDVGSLLFGSVSHELVRKSDCPVLVVR